MLFLHAIYNKVSCRHFVIKSSYLTYFTYIVHPILFDDRNYKIKVNINGVFEMGTTELFVSSSKWYVGPLAVLT